MLNSRLNNTRDSHIYKWPPYLYNKLNLI